MTTSAAIRPGGPGYRPEIDGLRAVAILAVVLYHARCPGFEDGYLGVDVFFVISGYLITGQLLREARSTGTIHMAMFYARRVRRLIPAFTTMAIGTSLLALLYLLPIGEQRLFGNALSRSAFFYYNIAVWRGGYAYDGEPAEQQALMHTWSLGVEEQFYLVWPWMCLIGIWIRRPLAAFSTVVVVSLVGSWWVLPRDVDAVFYLLPFRAWELGLGAVVASHRWSVSSRNSTTAASGGLVLVLLILLSGRFRESGSWAQVLVSLGTAAVVAFDGEQNRVLAFLQSSPMVYLGRISYAWYLWHWPLLVIERLSAVSEEPRLPLTALFAGLALAVVTHHWIEKPMRLAHIGSAVRVLAYGAIALGSVAILGGAMELRSISLQARPENAAFLDRVRPAAREPCETMVDSLGCDLSPGQTSGGPRLLLWGDSLARALSPALAEYSRESHSRVRMIVQPACPPLLGASPADRSAPLKPDARCREALAAVQERLRRDPAGIVGVILAARWPAHVPGSEQTKRHLMFDRNGRGSQASSATLSLGLDETLDLLEGLGMRVLIVGAPPAFPFEVPRCLLRTAAGCSVDRSFQAIEREQARVGIADAIRGRRFIRFIDVFEVLCPEQRCSAGTREAPLLADRSHLSADASRRLLLPILESHLDWLGGQR